MNSAFGCSSEAAFGDACKTWCGSKACVRSADWPTDADYESMWSIAVEIAKGSHRPVRLIFGALVAEHIAQRAAQPQQAGASITMDTAQKIARDCMGLKLGQPLPESLLALTVAPPQLSREQIGDIVREHLRGLYYCGRVWEAWSVGTMSEDDFSPAEELETADEIADSLLAGMTQASWAAQPQQATDDYDQSRD